MHKSAIILFAFVLAVVAGCPLQESDVDALPFAAPLEAGEYYVTDLNGASLRESDAADTTLQYASLPARGESATYATLPNADVTAAWYAGPGWYALDDSGAWTALEPADLSAFDDALQLHDAAPAAE